MDLSKQISEEFDRLYKLTAKQLSEEGIEVTNKSLGKESAIMSHLKNKYGADALTDALTDAVTSKYW